MRHPLKRNIYGVTYFQNDNVSTESQVTYYFKLIAFLNKKEW